MSVLLDKFAALSKAQGSAGTTDSAVHPQVSQEDVRVFQMHLQGGEQHQHLSAVPQREAQSTQSMPHAFNFDSVSKPVQGANQFQQSMMEPQKNLEGSKLVQKPVDGTNALPRSEQGREMSDTSISSTHKSVDNVNRSTSLEATSQSQTVNKEPLPKTKSHEATVQDFANEMKSQSDATSKSSEPSIESLFKDFVAMAAQMDGLTSPMPQVTEVQAKSPAGLDAIDLNELVSRILVNTPESGKAEVRLTLQDNVLRGTEISIARDNDGLLTVRIVTDNAASFQTLVATRNDLQAILQQQEGRIIVNVEMLDDSDSEQNDSRRRSKGLYDDEEEKDV